MKVRIASLVYDVRYSFRRYDRIFHARISRIRRHPRSPCTGPSNTPYVIYVAAIRFIDASLFGHRRRTREDSYNCRFLTNEPFAPFGGDDDDRALLPPGDCSEIRRRVEPRVNKTTGSTYPDARAVNTAVV